MLTLSIASKCKRVFCSRCPSLPKAPPCARAPSLPCRLPRQGTGLSSGGQRGLVSPSSWNLHAVQQRSSARPRTQGKTNPKRNQRQARLNPGSYWATSVDMQKRNVHERETRTRTTGSSTTKKRTHNVAVLGDVVLVEHNGPESDYGGSSAMCATHVETCCCLGTGHRWMQRRSRGHGLARAIH